LNSRNGPPVILVGLSRSIFSFDWRFEIALQPFVV
jgi:hypothetical protein